MNIISSGVFWGVFLILIGLSIIVKILFNIDIPVFRIVIGLFLVYFGLQVIFGSNFLLRRRGRRTKIKSEHYKEYNFQKRSNEYNVVFGRGEIDLTDRINLTSNEYVEINVVFGSALIYIDPKTPTQIEVTTVFGSADLPGRKSAAIGQEKYRTGDDTAGKLLFIDISSVFAGVEVIERSSDEDIPEGETERLEV